MANHEQTTEAIYDAKTLGTGKTLILGLQHLFAMFGATVLVPAITGLDVASTIAQRYDGSWLTSAQVLEMIDSGKLVDYYNAQQTNFGDAAGPLKADEFVLVDLMINAK